MHLILDRQEPDLRLRPNFTERIIYHDTPYVTKAVDNPEGVYINATVAYAASLLLVLLPSYELSDFPDILGDYPRRFSKSKPDE